ncbi:MAG TPA: ATP-binding protein [Elusimicrobiota bacterium]|nr:ATP-binding protein [Elusimicrobiota bacterium]
MRSESWLELFSTDGFMPHGHCYLWNRALIGLHVSSDALIALSYTSIPFTLAYFVRRRKDLPFSWMFVCFGAFIIACGATHYMEIWTLWHPDYWMSGVVKAITALVSIPTAYLLVKLIPRALSLPSHEQMLEVNRKLERSNREAEAALEQLETFSYSVAHDLRAPLRKIAGFSGALEADLERGAPDEARNCLRRILGNVEQMGRLIDGLLILSRVTKQELRRETVDLSALAAAAAEDLRKAAPERHAEFIIARGLEAEGDCDLLRVAVFNLLENAWKFTAQHPSARIEFGKAEKDGEPVYFVKDDGAGFEMAYVDKLFGPFKRLHAGHQFPGSGIGLATVQRVVLRHGGRIWAKGAVEKGATFSFTLGSRA